MKRNLKNSSIVAVLAAFVTISGTACSKMQFNDWLNKYDSTSQQLETNDMFGIEGYEGRIYVHRLEDETCADGSNIGGILVEDSSGVYTLVRQHCETAVPAQELQPMEVHEIKPGFAAEFENDIFSMEHNLKNPATINPIDPVKPPMNESQEESVEKEMPSENETPVEKEAPSENETPIEKEAPSENETPVEKEAPSDSETPVEKEIPSDNEIPVEKEMPSSNETPIEKESPEETVNPEEKAPISSEVPKESGSGALVCSGYSQLNSVNSSDMTEAKISAKQVDSGDFVAHVAIVSTIASAANDTERQQSVEFYELKLRNLSASASVLALVTDNESEIAAVLDADLNSSAQSNGTAVVESASGQSVMIQVSCFQHSQ